MNISRYDSYTLIGQQAEADRVGRAVTVQKDGHIENTYAVENCCLSENIVHSLAPV